MLIVGCIGSRLFSINLVSIVIMIVIVVVIIVIVVTVTNTSYYQYCCHQYCQ